MFSTYQETFFTMTEIYPELQCGHFDAESLWRQNHSARLPSVPSQTKNLTIAVMEELLFPWRKNASAYVTTLPVEKIHSDYLSTLRNDIRHINICHSVEEWRNTPSSTDYFERFQHHEDLVAVAQCYRFRPYAVTEGFCRMMRRFPDHPPPPPADIARKVNSKVFSTLLRQEIDDVLDAFVVRSTDELQEKILTATSTAWLIKDPFGVSGNGQYLIKDQRSASRIIEYLDKQIQQGAPMEFVLEPFTPFQLEFGCYFEITPFRLIRPLGLRITKNRGASYSASLCPDASFIARLAELDYFDSALSYCCRIAETGYWGPVCIDSGILMDGSIRTVLEINARISMGVIAQDIGSFVNKYGVECDFYCLDMAVKPYSTYSQLHDKLAAADLLWHMDAKAGIIPLTSGALGQLDSALKESRVQRSRWYVAIVGTTAVERFAVHSALSKLCKE